MKFQLAFAIKIYFMRGMSSKRTGFSFPQYPFIGAIYYIIFYAIVSQFSCNRTYKLQLFVTLIFDTDF